MSSRLHDTGQVADCLRRADTLSVPTMTAKRRAFLAAYVRAGNVLCACEIGRVGRTSSDRRLRQEPEYREAFEVAQQIACDVLQSEAIRRALDGTL